MALGRGPELPQRQHPSGTGVPISGGAHPAAGGANAREPAEQDFPDHRSYLAAFHAWDDEWEQLDASMTAGAIHLSHQGCGYFTWLVVNGPERDTLFTDPRAADRTLEPLTAGPHRVDFGGWYLSQLTRATSEAQRGPRQLASRRRVRE